MKSMKQLLASPKLKYGGYASLVTLAVIVGIIILNVVVDQLDLQLDLTDHGVYTLSEQTTDLLNELDEDVTIYVLAGRNEEPGQIMEALARYERASPRIRIQTIDAEKNPGFAAQYDPEGEGLRNGSLVVATGDNFRAIRGLDLYSIDDRNPQAPQILGLNVERRVTNALIYVATGRTPIIYQTIGRGERTVDQIGDLTTDLQTENYEIRTLNLIQAPQVPDDASVLLMMGPRGDISQGEADKIKEFLAGGGRAMFMVDVTLDEFAVLNELLAGYGMRYGSGVVIEGNQDYHTGNVLQLVPDVVEHPITSPLVEARSPILVPFGRPVEILDQKPRGVDITAIAVTSSDSFLRKDLSNDSTAKSSGDIDGPFSLALAAVERDFNTSAEVSRIVVVGNSGFIGNIFPFGFIPGNRDFFLNAVGWLQNQEESLSIRPKTTLQFPMQLTGSQVLIFGGLFVIVIPLAILITGLVIWLRRRHL